MTAPKVGDIIRVFECFGCGEHWSFGPSSQHLAPKPGERAWLCPECNSPDAPLPTPTDEHAKA